MLKAAKKRAFRRIGRRLFKCAGEGSSGGQEEFMPGQENRTRQELSAALPQLPASMRWELAVDTWDAQQHARPVDGNCFAIGPRSVKVFVAK